MTTTKTRTARYVIGDRALSHLVHQVRAAHVVWPPGQGKPWIFVDALCGGSVSGDRHGGSPTFAHDERDLPGLPCKKCAQAARRRRTLPNWKPGPPTRRHMPRVDCPACGKDVAITKTGSPVSHRTAEGRGCWGARSSPLPASGPRVDQPVTLLDSGPNDASRCRKPAKRVVDEAHTDLGTCVLKPEHDGDCSLVPAEASQP